MVASAIVGVLITKLDTVNNWLDWATYKICWYIVFPAATGLAGVALIRYGRHSDQDQKPAYEAIKKIYELAKLESVSGDVRCTVWVPHRFNSRRIPTHMRQLTDYVPKVSRNTDVQGRLNKGRPNAPAGRTFRVYRGWTEYFPVGIIGACALDATAKVNSGGGKSRVYVDQVPEGTTFAEYMVRQYNFRPRHAETMTQDRVAFMCFSMVNPVSKEFLGILYLDSNARGILGDETAAAVEKAIADVDLAGALAIKG